MLVNQVDCDEIKQIEKCSIEYHCCPVNIRIKGRNSLFFMSCSMI